MKLGPSPDKLAEPIVPQAESRIALVAIKMTFFMRISRSSDHFARRLFRCKERFSCLFDLHDDGCARLVADFDRHLLVNRSTKDGGS